MIEDEEHKNVAEESYHRGIEDAMSYSLDTLDAIYKGKYPEELIPAISAFYEVLQTAKDTRAYHFRQRMNAPLVHPLEGRVMRGK